MPIVVLCPDCSARLTAPDSAAGKNVKCPKCQTLMTLPAAPPPEPEPEPEFEVVEPPPPPPRKRPRVDDDEDATPLKLKGGEERPASRSKWDDDEDDEEEEEERPRRRKRPRRKKRRARSDDDGGTPFENFGPISIWVGIALVVWLIGLILGLIFPLALLIPVGIGFVIAIAGNIWFLVIAFKENVLHGVLCLVVPCYSLFYLITRWEACKEAFLVGLAGWFLYMVPMCAGGGFNNAREDRRRAEAMWVSPLSASRCERSASNSGERLAPSQLEA